MKQRLIALFDHAISHRDKLGALLVAGCLLLIALDFVIEKKPHFDFQNLPVFYGLIAVSAYTLLLILAKLCNKVLRRPEDYYDE